MKSRYLGLSAVSALHPRPVFGFHKLTADPRAFRAEREVGVHGAEDSETRARPGDVAGGGRTLLDVTAVNAFAAARISPERCAVSPALAAADAYDRKVRKYESLLPDGESVVRFVPVAWTASGVYDERSLRWLQEFSRVCASALGMTIGHAFDMLMQRLPVALLRHNSQLLCACFTAFEPQFSC